MVLKGIGYWICDLLHDCSFKGLVCLLIFFYLTILHDSALRFDSPLHNATVRSDHTMHNATGRFLIRCSGKSIFNSDNSTDLNLNLRQIQDMNKGPSWVLLMKKKRTVPLNTKGRSTRHWVKFRGHYCHHVEWTLLFLPPHPPPPQLEHNQLSRT
jgi:hypothetical protein